MKLYSLVCPPTHSIHPATNLLSTPLAGPPTVTSFSNTTNQLPWCVKQQCVSLKGLLAFEVALQQGWDSVVLVVAPVRDSDSPEICLVLVGNHTKQIATLHSCVWCGCCVVWICCGVNMWLSVSFIRSGQ